MPVCKIENATVVQRWDDVATLVELEAKYGLTGPAYVVASAAPGMIDAGGGSFTAPPPAPPILVDEVAKLALVRAMRMVRMDGAAVGQGDTSAWDQMKQAIAAAGITVQEDWDMAIRIPRLDPAMEALLTPFIPVQAQRHAVRDAVFTLAGQIEREEI